LQIEIIILAADIEGILASDKGKSLGKFQHEGTEVYQQTAFQLTFRDVGTKLHIRE
jgi:hypothetical protein